MDRCHSRKCMLLVWESKDIPQRRCVLETPVKRYKYHMTKKRKKRIATSRLFQYICNIILSIFCRLASLARIPSLLPAAVRHVEINYILRYIERVQIAEVVVPQQHYLERLINQPGYELLHAHLPTTRASAQKHQDCTRCANLPRIWIQILLQTSLIIPGRRCCWGMMCGWQTVSSPSPRTLPDSPPERQPERLSIRQARRCSRRDPQGSPTSALSFLRKVHHMKSRKHY